MIYREWRITAELREFTRCELEDDGSLGDEIDNTYWCDGIESLWIEKDGNLLQTGVPDVDAAKRIIDKIIRDGGVKLGVVAS